MVGVEQVKQGKKLLIATDCFPPRWDGVARFLNEVIPLLSQKFEVTVAAPKFPGEMHGFSKVNVVLFPTYDWKVGDINPARIRGKQLRKLVRNSDIVWTQSIGTIGALAMYYAKKEKKPLISFVHSVEWFLFSKSLKHFRKSVELTIRKLIRFLYRRCDVIMVPFEGMIPILEDEGITAKKDVVYLGVDSSYFRPPESKVLAKEKLGLNPNKLVIGYLGRFGREKDVATLYAGFRKLHDERPNTTLLLVGGDIHFDYMEDVRVVGPVDNTLPYYQAMDIYVLPSLTETTSLTTMEAMSCGVPVVVTPVGYIPKYVENRVNGFIFPPQNSERLYIALRKLVSDMHLRKELGSNARKTMTQKHDWKKVAEDIIAVFERF